MSGSKNTELTVKYAWRSLAAISFGLSSRCLVSYSTNPRSANTTASATTARRHSATSRASHSISRSRQNSSANGT